MSNPFPVPPATRPVAMGVNGMVASAHPLASLAGVRMLMDGGNAFDAAVATAAMLNVGEPYMSGVGGIGLALAYVAAEDRVRALNFSGRAPIGADPERFTDTSKETGILSALVPGNVAGWLALHNAYGKLDREKVFEPAIGYAENGVGVTHLNSRMMSNNAARLVRFPSAGIILGSNGKAPKPGAKLKMPQLAASLRSIAKGGADEFYRGDLARRIVRGSDELGGLITEEDLATYEPHWQDPISIDYRGYRIHTPPPNSSGFQILQTLKTMEGFSGDDLAFQHPDTLHLFIEAVKLAVTDRIKYAGDPKHVAAPVGGLLSSGYAEQQRHRIDRSRAAFVSGEHFNSKVAPEALITGNPLEFDGGMTTHFVAADRDGNVVSITQTLGGGFGSGVAVGDTGIFLNNMAYWFDLEEGSPNRIGPGKQVDFVVAPTQTFRDGRFHVSLGTPGSFGILQTTPQFVMNFLDFGMNIQQAIDAPRFRVYEGRRVQMEERLPALVRQSLSDLGHDVDVIEPWSMSVGGAQGIHADPDEGVFQGGADPRRDGDAIGC
jgi:gamma-glutamyltranspeptidase/glutathione hydrolase